MQQLRPTPLRIRQPQKRIPRSTEEQQAGAYRNPRGTFVHPDPPEQNPIINVPLLKVQTEQARKQARDIEKARRRATRELTPEQQRQLQRAQTKAKKKRNNYPPRKIQTVEYDGYVPRLYEGRIAVCMATGPSLTQDVIEAIRPFQEDGTIVAFGCNDAYKACDFLDQHYACDPIWWDHHVHSEWVAQHPAPKWCQDPSVRDKYGTNLIPGTSSPGLSTNQKRIHFGGNSGFQLLNFCFLFGVKLIILVGYNMGVPGGKKAHFFGDHPPPMSRASTYGSMVASFSTIQRPFRRMIVNATTQSNLNQFQRRDLKELLQQCQEYRDHSQDELLRSLGLAPA